jgi:hypothetical protein
MVLDTADVMRIASNEAMRINEGWNTGHLTLHKAILQRLDEIEKRLKTLEENQVATEKDVDSLLSRVLLLEQR